MNQQHGIPQAMGNVSTGMGISPMMQQSSPQQPQQQPQQQGGPQQQQQQPGPQNANPNAGGAHPQQQQQQNEKIDNISKVKSLAGPLRESLAVGQSVLCCHLVPFWCRADIILFRKFQMESVLILNLFPSV